MKLSANQATKEAGIAKKTLLDALKTGRLSAEKDERGHWKIEPSELFRVFPRTSEHQSPEPQPTPHGNQENCIEIERLKAALDAEHRLTASLSDQVTDLRTRLDREGEERRAMAAILTDQRKQVADTLPPAPRGLLDVLLGRGRTR